VEIPAFRNEIAGYGGFGQCILPAAPSRMKTGKEIKMTTAQDH